MLVVTRKFGEVIKIGDKINLTVIQGKGKQVKICIDAVQDLKIVRGELLNNNDCVDQTDL